MLGYYRIHIPGNKAGARRRNYLRLKRFMRSILISILVLGLAGCGIIYKLPTRQGNVIEQKQLDLLQLGMTRDQVKFLLGTPLVTDVFHGDRWDYVFRLRRGNGELITSHVTVFFKENKLDKVDGTLLPTEKEYITLIAGNAK